MKFNELSIEELKIDLKSKLDNISNDEIFELLEKYSENKKLDQLKNKLKYDIEKINSKLKESYESHNYINRFNIIRLKAFRTKSKEILSILEE